MEGLEAGAEEQAMAKREEKSKTVMIISATSNIS